MLLQLGKEPSLSMIIIVATFVLCKCFRTQNIGPDLDPNRLTLLIVFLKDFFKKLILRKVSRRQQKHEILPSMQRVKPIISEITVKMALLSG